MVPLGLGRDSGWDGISSGAGAFWSSEVPEGLMLLTLGCVQWCGEQVKGFPPTCDSRIPKLVLVKCLEMPGQDRNWGIGEGCGCKQAA